MTMPSRRPWPVAGRDGPNRYASVTTDYGPEVDRYVDQARDFTRAMLPYVPVVGPAYDAYEDIREGDYAGAAFNGAMAVAEATPVLPYIRALRLLRRVNAMRRGDLLARAGTAVARVRKVDAVPKGYEIHHTLPMAGWGPIPGASRKAEGLWRNNPIMLKPLPKDIHRRLTGKWGDQPQFGPAMRAWHGTNAVQKSTAAFIGSNAADSWENNTHPSNPVPARGRSSR